MCSETAAPGLREALENLVRHHELERVHGNTHIHPDKCEFVMQADRVLRSTPAATTCRHDDKFIEEFTAQVIEEYERIRSTTAAPLPDKRTHLFADANPDAPCPICRFPSWSHDPAQAVMHDWIVRSTPAAPKGETCCPANAPCESHMREIGQ